MTYCAFDEMAAAIDITFTKASDVNVERLLVTIYNISVPGVIVHEVEASFGSTDATAYIKTKLKPEDDIHPTWRIAQFAEKVFNLPNVARTNTRILIHDPHHHHGERSETPPKAKG